ncbi:MAG: 50S ribosomal protein L6 [Deltaproteobacteria bacterium]|nr:50S ribosomal protein L6 [Deltaproteobacteria bacterium]
MSRIGTKPIPVPNGVKVTANGMEIKVEGPKGKLSLNAHSMMKVKIEEKSITVERPDDSRKAKSLHGLTRTLISNMVVGVSEGFKRELDIKGVGYRAEVKGKTLNLTLGYSHPIAYPLPEGITAAVDGKKTHITIDGVDKQLVGSTAAKIRSFRKPEPYGGKGVRYSDERIIRKEGKAGGK